MLKKSVHAHTYPEPNQQSKTQRLLIYHPKLGCKQWLFSLSIIFLINRIVWSIYYQKVVKIVGVSQS